MELSHFLYQVAIIALSGIIIVGFTYFILKKHIADFLKIKLDNTPQKNDYHLLSLKLQAHERLALFVERINPANILIRLHQPGISVVELQGLVINEINAEYQHNITQQLYISSVVWSVARKLKEDTTAMIVNAAKGLPEDATGLELSRKLLQHLAQMDQNPYELTLDLIKKELHQQI